MSSFYNKICSIKLNDGETIRGFGGNIPKNPKNTIYMDQKIAIEVSQKTNKLRNFFIDKSENFHRMNIII